MNHLTPDAISRWARLTNITNLVEQEQYAIRLASACREEITRRTQAAGPDAVQTGKSGGARNGDYGAHSR